RRKLGRAPIHRHGLSGRLLHQLRALPAGVPGDGPRPLGARVTATVGRRGALPRPTAVMARAAGENFPVASRLLPRREREHLLALYGYARLVDDAGDEAPGDRSALLNEIDAELNRIYAGENPRHALMARLAAT